MKKSVILLLLIVNIGGAQDNYLSFDGVDDYVAINGNSSNIANLTNSSFSFSVWAFPTGVPSETGQIICRTGHHLGIEYQPSKYINALIWDENSKAYHVGISNSNENSWHHFVYTYNSITRSMGFYVDGVSIGSVTMEADIKNYSTDYIVGMGNTDLSSPHSYPFSGNIDELAFFDKVLSSDEILELYKSGGELNLTSNSGNYVSSSNLVGYWRFDEGTGTTVADASGNNNSGTIYRGATWKSNTVKNVPARYSTIQSGINAASAGDTVLVADGTYTENLDIDKDIKIISENGAEKTIIDGAQKGTTISFSSNTTREAIIDGFTITNGGNSDTENIQSNGSGITIQGEPTLKNLIIINNRGLEWNAGGITVHAGNPLITDCVITVNIGKGSGGVGIQHGASAEILNCKFSNNKPLWYSNGIQILSQDETSNLIMKNVEFTEHECNGCGPVINISGPKTSAILEDIKIQNNSSDHAIRVSGGASLNMSNSIISDNKISFGCLYIKDSSIATISNSIFQNNEAVDWGGGGLKIETKASVTLNNVTISNNTANNGGGGISIYKEGSLLANNLLLFNNISSEGGLNLTESANVATFVNSTIIGNRATGTGAKGIHVGEGKVRIMNSIVRDNGFSVTPDKGSLIITHSNVEGGWDGEGNIDARPHFIDAANGDYHIGDYSLGIGAGVYSAQFDDTWYYAPSTDLDGNPRPNPAGSMPDMGAYENPRATPQHAPEPFELVFPFDSTHIGITRHNYLDTLYFAWNKAIDIDGDAVRYRPILTGDLTRFFLITSNTDTTIWKIPYHHVEHYMHTEGIEFAQGTWTMVASDGGMDTYASNGPFLLTIDASAYAVDDEAVLPESFALHANYPNPFNPTTTISYDLPEQSQITLGIYDILGKQIKTLINQSQDAGSKIAIWDGTDNLGRQVSAGVYLYQIQAGAFTQTRKMLLLK